MAYQTSYAGIKADLLQNSDDYSADFLAHLDTIIAESEIKVLVDLDLEIFQNEVAAGTLTSGSRTFQMPAGMVKINALWLTVGAARKYIERRTKGYCEMYGEDPTVQERPTYWANQTENVLFFVNTPDQAYPVIVYGIVRPAGLGPSVPTTWVSLYAGHLLFMAAKMRAEQYLLDPTAAGQWSAEYNNDLLPKAKIELRGLARSTYETPRVVSAPSQVV